MRNNFIKASIIVPVFNCRKYLDRCLLSLMQIKYSNLEFILVNDGSTDGSKSICEAYADRDERFKIIDKENGGVSSARNAGIQKAQGQWISFVDGDDLIVSNTYDHALYFLDTAETADMLLMNLVETGEQTDLLNQNAFPVKKLKAEEKDILKAGILNLDDKEYQKYKSTYIPSPVAKFYRADILYKNNIFFDEDVVIGEDRIFNYRYILKTFDLYHLEMAGYFYVQNADSVMHKYVEGNGIKYLISVEKFSNFIEEPDWQYLALYGVRQYIAALKIDYCSLYNKKKYRRRKKDSDLFLQNSLIKQCFKDAEFRELKKVAAVMGFLSKMGAFVLCDILWKAKERCHIKFD